MISKSTMTFLKNLRKNNNRSWFDKHREEYEVAKGEWKEFAHALAREIATFDPAIKKALGNKKTVKIFRIYRDVRFAKDKTPYNSQMSATISPSGKTDSNGFYYIRIKPGETMFGAGVHQPNPIALNKIRKSFEKNAKPFRKILAQPSFKKIYKGLEDFDLVKTAPRGYDKNDPAIDLIRHKGFFVVAKASDSKVISKNFRADVAKKLKVTKPFVDYLTKVAK